MHFKHGYGERDLKAMFQISIQTVRKILSHSSIVSPARFTAIQESAEIKKLTQKITSIVNDLVDSRRDRITV
jgi:hypothetical protein